MSEIHSSSLNGPSPDATIKPSPLTTVSAPATARPVQIPPTLAGSEWRVEVTVPYALERQEVNLCDNLRRDIPAPHTLWRVRPSEGGTLVATVLWRAPYQKEERDALQATLWKKYWSSVQLASITIGEGVSKEVAEAVMLCAPAKSTVCAIELTSENKLVVTCSEAENFRSRLKASQHRPIELDSFSIEVVDADLNHPALAAQGKHVVLKKPIQEKIKNKITSLLPSDIKTFEIAIEPDASVTVRISATNASRLKLSRISRDLTVYSGLPVRIEIDPSISIPDTAVIIPPAVVGPEWRLEVSVPYPVSRQEINICDGLCRDIPAPHRLWRVRPAVGGGHNATILWRSSDQIESQRALQEVLNTKYWSSVYLSTITIGDGVTNEVAEAVMLSAPAKSVVCSIDRRGEHELVITCSEAESFRSRLALPLHSPIELDGYSVTLIEASPDHPSLKQGSNVSIKTKLQNRIKEKLAKLIPAGWNKHEIILEPDLSITVKVGTTHISRLEVSRVSRDLAIRSGVPVRVEYTPDIPMIREAIRAMSQNCATAVGPMRQLNSGGIAVEYTGSTEHRSTVFWMLREHFSKANVGVDLYPHCRTEAAEKAVRRAITDANKIESITFQPEKLRMDVRMPGCHLSESERKRLEQALSVDTGWSVVLAVELDDEQLAADLTESTRTPGGEFTKDDWRVRVAVRRDWAEVAIPQGDTKTGTDEIVLSQTRRHAPLPILNCPVEPVDTIGYGACREIGRSAFYFRFGGIRVLVDCGANIAQNTIPELSSDLIRSLDFVVLSHAHLDHSGMLPWLYKRGCTAPVLATPATIVLAQFLQQDSMHFQRRFGDGPPNFSPIHVMSALHTSYALDFGRRFQLGKDLYVTLHQAGHLPGSAMVEFECAGKSILYGADLLLKDTRLLSAAKLPSKTDHLFLETTRAAQFRPDAEFHEREALHKISDCLDRGGKVIMPSFAAGRAQELLLFLLEREMFGGPRGCPIYVDGMINEINVMLVDLIRSGRAQGLSERALELGERAFNPRSGLYTIVERKEDVFWDDRPGIILTTSGMCEGPAAKYIAHYGKDPKNLLMTTGYQAPGTLGYEIQSGQQSIRHGGRTLNIQLETAKMGLSGHSYREELEAAIAQLSPRSVLTIHGESNVMDAFTAQSKLKFPDTTFISPRLGVATRLS